MCMFICICIYIYVCVCVCFSLTDAGKLIALKVPCVPK